MAVLRDKNQRNFRIYQSAETPSTTAPLNFNKILVDGKVLRDDVVAILDGYSGKTARNRKYKKEDIIRALGSGSVKELRNISNYFYNSGGIYKNLCLYMAHLYKYD